MNIQCIIDEVLEKYNFDEEDALTKTKILNIVKSLAQYPIEKDEDFRMALEYSIKLREQVIRYTESIKAGYKHKYDYFTRVDYSTEKVLRSMGILEDNVPKYYEHSKDSVIKNIIRYSDFIEAEIKITMMENMKRQLTR